MIKPATLWSQFKTCSDPLWLGNLCRALGGQDVDLDFGQRQMLAAIRLDSGWMDERIEEQRDRWRDRQRKSRAKSVIPQSDDSEADPTDDSSKCDMSQCHACHGDICDTRDNGTKCDMSQCHTCHDTSVRPSVRPNNNISGGGGLAHTRARVREKSATASTKPPKTTPQYPTKFSAIEDYFESIQLLMFDPNGVKAHFLSVTDAGWKDNHGKKISDWRAYMATVCKRLNVQATEPKQD